MADSSACPHDLNSLTASACQIQLAAGNMLFFVLSVRNAALHNALYHPVHHVSMLLTPELYFKLRYNLGICQR